MVSCFNNYFYQPVFSDQGTEENDSIDTAEVGRKEACIQLIKSIVSILNYSHDCIAGYKVIKLDLVLQQ